MESGPSEHRAGEGRLRAPARPLLPLCAALVAGGLWGTLAPPRPELLALAIAAGAGLWLGLWAACRSDAPGAMAASRPRVHASGLCLALLVLVSALRASAGREGPQPGGGGLAEREGRWIPTWNGADGARGRVQRAGEDGPLLDLPPGAAEPGERIRVLEGAERVEPPRGPIPRRSWLFGASAPDHHKLRADEVVRTAERAGAAGPWIGWRKVLLERCERLQDETSRGLARAFLLGDGSHLGPELADLFARNGLRHVLAVSGWHVGWMVLLCFAPLAWMLASAAARLAGRARLLPRALASALLAALVLVYIPMTGNEAPVRRAAIACALALGSRWLPRPLASSPGARTAARRPDMLSLWALALLLECAADPRAPTRLSLALSYLATLGLALFTRPVLLELDRWLGVRSSPGGREPVHGWRSPAWQSLVILRRRCARWLRLGVAASLAAVLATMPIVWPCFGEWSPMGVLSTPLLLPLFSWLLLSGTLLLALPAWIPESLFSAPAHALLATLRWLDRWPGTPAPLPDRPLGLLWLALGAWVLVLALKGRDRARRIAARCAWLLAGVALLPWTPAPARLEVVALDVGHGTALAMREPGGGVWLFDCGSRDRSRVAQEALAPLLARWECRRTAVVLSHEDLDHASGLPWLVERHPPWLWAGAVPAPLAERLAHTAQVLDLAQGRTLLPGRPGGSGGAVVWELLRGASVGGREDNEGSRTLLARCGGELLVLCGDAEEDGLAALLDAGFLQGPSRLLLLPHHGSDTPHLGRLLEAAQPSEVWVSASRAPRLTRELERRGLLWRATAGSGSSPGGPLLLSVPGDPAPIGLP